MFGAFLLGMAAVLTQRFANLLFVFILLLASGYFAWIAEGFQTTGLLASAGLPSKFFPQLTLCILVICALSVGYQYIKTGSVAGDNANDTVFVKKQEARQGILMLVVSVVCYVIWRNLGFIPMMIAIGPFSLLAMGIFRPASYGIVLALSVLVSIIFVYALGVRLI